MQLDNQILDQIAQNLIGVFDQVSTTREEAIRKVREVVSEGVDHFDLVTREEFDAAQRLLSNTRVKLEVLEKQVAALEAAQTGDQPEDDAAKG